VEKICGKNGGFDAKNGGFFSIFVIWGVFLTLVFRRGKAKSAPVLFP